MNKKEVYKKLTEEIERLYNPVREQLPQFIMQVYELYIAPHLERLPLVKAEKGYKPTPLEQALSNSEVLQETIKVITLMEASDNLEEFKDLTEKRGKKRTPKKKERTDFDKILGAMMKVPNPNKGKKSKKQATK